MVLFTPVIVPLGVALLMGLSVFLNGHISGDLIFTRLHNFLIYTPPYRRKMSLPE